MMEATRTGISEDQAEKLAEFVKTLLLNPDQMLDAVDHPVSALEAAGLHQEDISQIKEYLRNIAVNLEAEEFPWIS